MCECFGWSGQPPIRDPVRAPASDPSSPGVRRAGCARRSSRADRRSPWSTRRRRRCHRRPPVPPPPVPVPTPPSPGSSPVVGASDPPEVPGLARSPPIPPPTKPPPVPTITLPPPPWSGPTCRLINDRGGVEPGSPEGTGAERTVEGRSGSVEPDGPGRKRAATADDGDRDTASAEGECQHQRAHGGRAAQCKRSQPAIPFRALLDRTLRYSRADGARATDVEDRLELCSTISGGEDDERHGDDFLLPLLTGRLGPPWDGMQSPGASLQPGHARARSRRRRRGADELRPQRGGVLADPRDPLGLLEGPGEPHGRCRNVLHGRSKVLEDLRGLDPGVAADGDDGRGPHQHDLRVGGDLVHHRDGHHTDAVVEDDHVRPLLLDHARKVG